LNDADLAKIVKEMETLKLLDYVGTQFGKKALTAIAKSCRGKKAPTDFETDEGMEHRKPSIFEQWRGRISIHRMYAIQKRPLKLLRFGGT
jgi:hypothetical protein